MLLTNLFPVWNSCGCNISIATCGAGDNRAWLSIAMVNLDALFHDAFCRALHNVWELLMQGCQLQRLRAFYCVARCGQDCRISIGTRDSQAGAEKCADSKKFARICAEISYMRMCASLCVRKWCMAIPNRDGTVSAIGLYIGMHWPRMRLGSDA